MRHCASLDGPLGHPVASHLSTRIKEGINLFLLYRFLAKTVVTTCEEVATILRKQNVRAVSIPTGINPEKIRVNQNEIEAFRQSLNLSKDARLAGTLCVIRSWKGISAFLQAAKLMEHVPNLYWIVIGGGDSEARFRKECESLNLQKRVFFTGYLENPFPALAALDVFLLLSEASEGVSQASLQAAFLKKPLITTRTGGLKEVTIEGETGFQVSNHAPQEVAQALTTLLNTPSLQRQMGNNAHKLSLDHFTLDKTINAMEAVYSSLL